VDIRPDIALDITPDTKDWTWVLDRPCPDCGLDTSRVSGSAVPGILRTSADSWRSALRRQDVRERPNPSTWAPVEYACHVRDVCLLFDSRLGLMLTMDDPEFDSWDQDATAIRQRYTDAIPQVVGAELSAAAQRIAEHFDTVTGAQWQRSGRRSDGARFTVESFARYFIHDVVHHLHDVGAPLTPANPSV